MRRARRRQTSKRKRFIPFSLHSGLIPQVKICRKANRNPSDSDGKSENDGKKWEEKFVGKKREKLGKSENAGKM